MNDLSGLGDLVVSIGGDISPLQDALGEIPALAQKAGQEFDAFMAAGLPGTQALATATNDVVQAAQAVGEAAQNATAPMTGLSDAAESTNRSLAELGSTSQNTAPAVQQTADSTEQLVRQLIALGQALLIVEGLKAFTEEALSVYAAVQKFQVGMDLLTGSIDMSRDALDQVEAIAKTEPFAFPEILPAVQKLAAFGIQGQQLVQTMHAAGDAAAATGNSFDAVSAALGRVELTGQVTARQLVQLGLSWGDLAKAMGTSIEDAQAKLKKGGQDAAADMDALLQAVEQKFGGAAQILGQTLSGQWQVFVNQVHLLMDNIGSALAPLAQALLSFAQTEILPFLNNLIDEFKQLPGPVQTAIEGIGGLAVVALPAAIAIGTLTIGLAKGLEALKEFGLVSQALSLGGLATGLIAIGVAVTTAIVAWHELIDIWNQLKTLFPDIGSGLASITEELNNMIPASQAAKEFVSGFTQAWKTLLPIIAEEATGALGSLAAALRSVNDLLGKSAEMTDAMKGAVQKQTDAVHLNAVEMAADALAVASGAKTVAEYAAAHDKALASLLASNAAQIAHATAVRAVSDAYTQQQKDLAAARLNLDAVTEGLRNGTASAGQYADAQAAVEKALIAINPATLTAAQYQKTLDDATKQLDASNKTLAATMKSQTQPAIMDVATAQAALAKAQNDQRAATIAYQLAWAALNGELLKSHPSYQSVITDQGLLATATKNLDDANAQVVIRTKDVTASQKDATEQSKLLEAARKAYQEGLEALNPVEKTVAAATAELDAARAKLASDSDTLLNVSRELLALPKDDPSRPQLEKDLAAATAQEAQAKKDVTTATADLTTARNAELAISKLMLEVNRDADVLVKDHILPNTLSLQQAIDNVRQAKERLLIAYNEEKSAQAAVNQLDMEGMRGTQQYQQAIDALKASHASLKDAEKDVNDQTGVLTGTFHASKDAVDQLTTSTNTAVTSAQDLGVAFSTLGLQVPQTLQDMATQADAAFVMIRDSGIANSKQLLDAQIADLQKRQQAQEAAGRELTREDQRLLNDLLAQQRLYNIQNRELVQDWAGAWVDSIKQINQAITRDLGQAFSDLIFNIGKVGDDFKKLGEDIVNIVINHIIAEAMKPLLNMLDSVLGKLLGGSGTSGGGLLGGFGSVQKAGTDCFGGIASASAPALENTVNLGDAVAAVAPEFANLGEISNTTFSDMASMLDQATGGMTSLSDAAQQMGTDINSLSSDLGQFAGSSGGGLGGSLSGALSGLSDALSGVLNIVTAIVQIASDVYQAVQSQRIADLLGEIEKSTRGTLAQLVSGIQPSLNEFLPVIKEQYDFMAGLQLTILEEMRDLMKAFVGISVTFASGGSVQDLGKAIGQYLSASNTAQTDVLGRIDTNTLNIDAHIVSGFQKLFDQANTDTQIIAGQIKALNDASNSFLGKLESGLLGGVGGLLGGVGSIGAGLAGGVIGAITALFGGSNADKVQAQIEENTRYTQLYLGGRGDQGILGVLFRILDVVQYGTAEKNSFRIADGIDALNKWGVADLDAIKQSMWFATGDLDEIVQNTASLINSNQNPTSKDSYSVADLDTIKETLWKIQSDLDYMKNPTGKESWAVADLDEIKNNTYFTATKLDVLIGAAIGGPQGALAALAEQAAAGAQKTADSAEAAAKAAQAQVVALENAAKAADAAAKVADATAAALDAKAKKASDTATVDEQKAKLAEEAVNQAQSLTNALKKASDAADALYEANPTPDNKQKALEALAKYIDATAALQAATKTANEATDAANQAKAAADTALKNYTEALANSKTADQKAVDLTSQITAQIKAAAQAETAAQAAQAAATAAQAAAENAAGKVTVGTGSGSGPTDLAGLLNAQFATLENWLAPIFRSLLVPTGGQGLAVPPTQPSAPAGTPGTSAPATSSTAAPPSSQLQLFDAAVLNKIEQHTADSLTAMSSMLSAMSQSLLAENALSKTIQAMADQEMAAAGKASAFYGMMTADLDAVKVGLQNINSNTYYGTLKEDASLQELVKIEKLMEMLTAATSVKSAPAVSITSVSGGTVDNPTLSGSGSPRTIELHTHFNGPVYGGQAGMRELTDKVNNSLVDRLRQAGLKFQ